LYLIRISFAEALHAAEEHVIKDPFMVGGEFVCHVLAGVSVWPFWNSVKKLFTRHG
jgi:hypothetical protein